MPIEKLRPSFTFTEDRLEELKAVVPEAFADGKINWETLREALGDYIEDPGQEHFGLSWPGKREARRLSVMPSKGTLIPQVGEGIDEDSTHNIHIDGDNLEVLKLLQKSYASQIKMIYIDPPYNTGNDFVYPDNYNEPLEAYLARTGQLDEAGKALTTNTRASGRFHSNWLNMMYPRLLLARTLLQNDGAIFVSIDDSEVHNLRQMMNEVFGEENFIDCIIWKKRYGGGAKEKFLVTLHEYILFYAKDIEAFDSLYVPLTEESIKRYYKLKDDNFEIRGPYRTHPLEATKSMGDRPNLIFAITAPDGTEILPKRQWLWSRERVAKALKENGIEFVKGNDSEWKAHSKQYLRDQTGKTREAKAFSIIDNVYSQHGTNEILDLFGDAQIFSFPKPTGLIKPLLQLITDEQSEDIVLDFFAGSSSTADSLLRLNRKDGGNRRFILVQLPEPTNGGKFSTISEIGRERIRRVLINLKSENKGKLILHPSEDLGFKCFRLDKSSYQNWQLYENKDTLQLETLFDKFETPLVEGWNSNNLLVEILLIQGYPLDSQIVPLDEIENNSVKRVHAGGVGHDMFVCLDDKVKDETIQKLNLRSEDIFVCLDSALSDGTKIRLADQTNLKVI